jgi:hypothetical protein
MEQHVGVPLDPAARRARAEGRSTQAERDRYLAHGILHLLGFDHERPEDARVMAEQEAALARAEGLVGAALRKGRRGAPMSLIYRHAEKPPEDGVDELLVPGQPPA